MMGTNADKIINVVFDCDQWKSTASLRFICACTDDCLGDVLANIKADHDYTDEDMGTYIHIERTTLNEMPY